MITIFHRINRGFRLSNFSKLILVSNSIIVIPSWFLSWSCFQVNHYKSGTDLQAKNKNSVEVWVMKQKLHLWQYIGKVPISCQALTGPNKKSDVSTGPFLRFNFFPRHSGVLFWTQIFISNSCNDSNGLILVLLKLNYFQIVNYK